MSVRENSHKNGINNVFKPVEILICVEIKRKQVCNDSDQQSNQSGAFFLQTLAIEECVCVFCTEAMSKMPIDMRTFQVDLKQTKSLYDTLILPIENFMSLMIVAVILAICFVSSIFINIFLY